MVFSFCKGTVGAGMHASLQQRGCMHHCNMFVMYIDVLAMEIDASRFAGYGACVYSEMI